MQLSVCVAENGPYHIKEDLSLERSEYGWDVNSNMIFVDQPINTGFSYSDVSMHISLDYTANWPLNLSLANNDQTVLSLLATLHSQDPRDRVYNEDTVSEDMLEFLQAFLEGTHLYML